MMFPWFVFETRLMQESWSGSYRIVVSISQAMSVRSNFWRFVIVSICEDFHVAVLNGVSERKCSRLVCCLGRICECFFLSLDYVVS